MYSTMYSTERVLLLMIIAGTILYIVYACYLITKAKHQIDECQERRIATFMLFIIFFALAMIYMHYSHSCFFIVLWFIYALWLFVKETRATIQGRRRTDQCFPRF